MRSSKVILRGAKGYGWYYRFKELGAEGFKKSAPPAAFDWENTQSAVVPRPKAFFDLSLGSEPLGRIVFELASDVVPKTVENFKLLCTGAGPSGKSYKGAKFHIVDKKSYIMGGDVETPGGTLSHSAYKERYIRDENYIIPHAEEGIIRYSASCIFMVY